LRSAAGAGSLLRAVLNDPLVPLRSLDAAPALGDEVTHRLLDVDVLARLAGPDSDERVPVVRRGDRDGVEVLVLERLADVFDALRGDAILLLDRLAPRFPKALVRVDQVGDLDAGELEVLSDMSIALAVDAADADADGVVGPEDAARRFRARDRDRGGLQRVLEKTATSGLGH